MQRWLQRLIRIRHEQNLIDGPAICDENGLVLTSSELNERLHEALTRVYSTDLSLFLKDIQSSDDIESKYDVFRTFSRGSDLQALSKGVSGVDIDIFNRWAKREKDGGSRPGMAMKHHYADIHLLLEPFLRYTQAMYRSHEMKVWRDY